MKKIFFTAFLLLSFLACSTTPSNKVEVTAAQAAAIGNGQTLTVDIDKSQIHWKGTKPGGEHTGTLGIKEGGLTLTKAHEVTAGSFVIDMNDMVNLDLEDSSLNKALLDHLKSADFFEVETYPASNFTITEVIEASKEDTVTHFISGNLKMKDVENNIKFGANISANVVKEQESYKTTYTARTVVFAIDRTEWNVKYGSKKALGELADAIVDDNIELQITIVAHATPIK